MKPEMASANVQICSVERGKAFPESLQSVVDVGKRNTVQRLVSLELGKVVIGQSRDLLALSVWC